MIPRNIGSTGKAEYNIITVVNGKVRCPAGKVVDVEKCLRCGKRVSYITGVNNTAEIVICRKDG